MTNTFLTLSEDGREDTEVVILSRLTLENDR